jgi:very-short-patch-repair endonuclease
MLQIRSKKGKSTRSNTTYKKKYWTEHIASVGETRIQKWLNDHNIFHLTEARFSDNKNTLTDQLLSFDFFIPKYKLCIEYQGEGHTMYIRKFHGNKNKGNFEKQKAKDQLKRDYCKRKGYKLLEIYWKDWKDIEKILEKELIKKPKN